jgi:hypothetical protein
MKKFFYWLKELSNIVKESLEINEPIIWGDGDREKYESAVRCYCCNKEFTKNNYKVADHCHYYGKFRGAACNDCNLQLKFTNYKLPVYFHNDKGFDFHQSILIHRNSGFRGVGVPFNRKLGSKICKKIFETWRRCNFSSCIFLAVDRS